MKIPHTPPYGGGGLLPSLGAWREASLGLESWVGITLGKSHFVWISVSPALLMKMDTRWQELKQRISLSQDDNGNSNTQVPAQFKYRTGG